MVIIFVCSIISILIRAGCFDSSRKEDKERTKYEREEIGRIEKGIHDTEGTGNMTTEREIPAGV